MPKITSGGVSNRLVDPDFIAEPGTPVEKAIDDGLPDVGRPSEDEPGTEHDERAPKDPAKDGNRDDQLEPDQADSWDPAPKPDNQTPGMDTPKKSTPAKRAASKKAGS